LAAGQDDGIFGQATLDAFNHYRASKGKPPVAPFEFTPTQVNADLFPDDPPPPPVKRKRVTIWQLLPYLSTLDAILKGKIMNITADQLTGIARLALALAAGVLIGKGWVTQEMWDWISAGVLTAVPAIWGWYNNRPKTIEPLRK
jgi:hypothetical protein